MIHLACRLLLALCLAPVPAAQDWPHWRGPDRDGVSRESGWSLEGEELWRTGVGLGYSAVSIRGGRLYTMGHDADAQRDTVYCLDAATGKEHWTHGFAAKTWSNRHDGGTLTTPSVTEGRVFVSNREGRLLCLEATSGEVRWSRDLAQLQDLAPPGWGWAASPLIVGEQVVMNVGRVLAFGMDGELQWKTERDYGECYSTPVDLSFEERRLIAVFNSTGLVLLDPATGQELALFPWGAKPALDNVNAPTPVIIGDRIFLSSGYNRGCALLGLGEELKPLWQSRVMNNEEAGCVHFEGHLYGFDRSVLKCLNLDGEVEWSKRGLGKGAFSIADGKLLILSARGDLIIAEATAEEFRELASTSVLEGGRNWTSPVLCGGLIYCRNSSGDLVCRDHRGDARR